MPRKPSQPKYRLHKQSGQAVVTFRDGLGGQKDVLLGKYGTPESWEKYGREIAEWEANGRRLFTAAKTSDITVAVLVSAYYVHASTIYRGPDGTPGKEVDNIKDACRPLYHLYSQALAKDFGPRALKAVRQLMIDGYKHPRHGEQRPLARTTINRRVGRLKHLFRWAVSEELVPAEVLHALEALAGLERGRSSAREPEPVRPVHPDAVKATVPFMPPVVADMVELQQLTAMRSGELTRMRAIDLDMGNPKCWLYRPGSDRGPQGEHKTSHHGHERIILLGPKAQEIVRKYLKTDLLAYLFSPKETVAGLQARRRANRKTKVQPSQQDRRKRNPKRKAGDRYTRRSYYVAVERACDLAFPAPAHLQPRVKTNGKRETRKEYRARLTTEEKAELKSWQKAHRWFPHQLRHGTATELRKYGLDVAKTILGHSKVETTQIYAEKDLAAAMELVAKIG